MKQVLLLSFLLFIVASVEALAEDMTPWQVNVVLFVPADVRPPIAYQQRIDDIVTYA